MYDIRAMNIHIITAVATTPFMVSKLKMPSVTITAHKGNSISLRVKGDFNPALRAITQYDLTDLDMTHANLEDIFLGQYKGEKI